MKASPFAEVVTLGLGPLKTPEGLWKGPGKASPFDEGVTLGSEPPETLKGSLSELKGLPKLAPEQQLATALVVGKGLDHERGMK